MKRLKNTLQDKRKNKNKEQKETKTVKYAEQHEDLKRLLEIWNHFYGDIFK